jgi:hypothetical protein
MYCNRVCKGDEKALSTEISAIAAAAAVAIHPARRTRTIGAEIPGCAIARKTRRRHRRTTTAIPLAARTLRTAIAAARLVVIIAVTATRRESWATATIVTATTVAATRPLAGFVATAGGIVTEDFIGLPRQAGADAAVQTHLGADTALTAITAHDLKTAGAIMVSGEERRRAQKRNRAQNQSDKNRTHVFLLYWKVLQLSKSPCS